MSLPHADPISGSVGDDMEQIHGHQLDYPKSDQLSDELADLLDTATEDDFDVDKLDSLLESLDQSDSIPDSASFDPQKGYAEFQKRLSYKDSIEKAAVGTHSKRRPVRLISRFAIAAAIIVVLLAGTAQAFHINIFNLVAQWTSGVFQLTNAPEEHAEITKFPLAEGETREYDSVEAMLYDFGITAPIFPTLIPERFVLERVSATHHTLGHKLFALYKTLGGSDSLICSAEDIVVEAPQIIEKDSRPPSSIIINGIVHYYFRDKELVKATWQNGNIKCYIYGNLSDDELQTVLNSIYKG